MTLVISFDHVKGSLLKITNTGDKMSLRHSHPLWTLLLILFWIIAPSGATGQSSGSASSATVTVTGGEMHGQHCTTIQVGREYETFCVTIYDEGTVSLTVNGFPVSVGYGEDSSTASVAEALAAGFNVSGSPVSATVSSSTITLTANVIGYGVDYSFSASSATLDTDGLFSSPSFSVTPTSGSMSGGTNATTLTLASSSNPSPNGENVTFTANISSGATGSVTFLDGGNTIGTGTISGTTATFTTSALALGTHTITASYAGNGVWGAVTSSALTETVQVDTVVTLTPSANPSQYGPVTFNAMVNTGGFQPSGTVQFMDGNAELQNGTVTVQGTSTTNLLPYSQQFINWASPYCGNSSNETPNTSDLTAPDGSWTATKFVMPSTFTCGSGGGWGAIGSISGGLVSGNVYTISIWMKGAVGGEQVYIGLADGIGPGNPFVLTTSWQRYTWTSPPYVSAGQDNRGFEFFSYSPSATYYVWGAQTEQAGSVGPYVMTGSNSASGAGGTATITTPTLAVGAHSITAAYSGAENVLASTSPVLSQTVNAAGSITEEFSSLNPSAFGNAVTFTSYIDTGGGVPTGTVTLADGGSALSTVTVSPISTTNLLPYSQQISQWSGANSLTAVDNATTAPDGTSSASILTANAGATDAYVINNVPNPSVNSSETVTGSVWLRVPSGTLNLNLYLTDTGSSGWGIVANTSVTLTPSWKRFQISGPTQSALTQLGLQIGGSTSWTANQVVDVWGGQIEAASSEGPYVATAASPTGGFGGVATFTTSLLGVDLHLITSSYSGDNNVNGSTSYAVAQTVNQQTLLTPTITWATPAPITYGTAISTTQLNASASYSGNSISGTFTYTPPLDTILPAGQTILTATFTPTDIIDYSVTTATVVLTVNGSVAITPASLPVGTQSAAYSAPLNASGGQAPYTWSVASGALPLGLQLVANGTTGALITGTPLTTGNSSFAIQARDSNSLIGTATFSIGINPPGDGSGPSIFSVTPSSGMAGAIVTVFGDNFGDAQGSSTITLNGFAVSVYQWNNSTIVFMVPSNAAEGSLVLTITVNGNSSSSGFTVSLPSCS